MKKYYHILSAAIIGEYTLHIHFSDGASQKIDFEPFLRKSTNPEIRKYLDPSEFTKFEIKNGELMWGDFDLLFPMHELREGKIAGLE